jgi:hypothetical protein
MVTHDQSLDKYYFDKVFEIKEGKAKLVYIKE